MGFSPPQDELQLAGYSFNIWLDGDFAIKAFNTKIIDIQIERHMQEEEI